MGPPPSLGTTCPRRCGDQRAVARASNRESWLPSSSVEVPSRRFPRGLRGTGPTPVWVLSRGAASPSAADVQEPTSQADGSSKSPHGGMLAALRSLGGSTGNPMSHVRHPRPPALPENRLCRAPFWTVASRVPVPVQSVQGASVLQAPSTPVPPFGIARALRTRAQCSVQDGVVFVLRCRVGDGPKSLLRDLPVMRCAQKPEIHGFVAVPVDVVDLGAERAAEHAALTVSGLYRAPDRRRDGPTCTLVSADEGMSDLDSALVRNTIAERVRVAAEASPGVAHRLGDVVTPQRAVGGSARAGLEIVAAVGA
ncbi:hypothetical protein SAMN04488085_10472 [Geodermatophilus ruber]|uniref:Uncharacterized protein n=1 Tax=Geodermatophilus ruber TaxID=504800 RepID=A0A1I4CYE8_9ACTN|nr:hypothetical protein SAMN04488085_10472 [Geodermatophilus ruber]